MQRDAFRSWIKEAGGSRKLAPRLKVSDRTIRFWEQGVTAPRLKTMHKIIRLSKNKLTIEDILINGR